MCVRVVCVRVSGVCARNEWEGCTDSRLSVKKINLYAFMRFVYYCESESGKYANRKSIHSRWVWFRSLFSK